MWGRGWESGQTTAEAPEGLAVPLWVAERGTWERGKLGNETDQGPQDPAVLPDACPGVSVLFKGPLS